MTTTRENEPTVCTVIVNWNEAAQTIACVRSVIHCEYRNISIIVVDNGSSDGSEKKIRETYPDIVVVQTGRNVGYSEGANVGIRCALQTGVDYVWLLNNDAEVAQNSLSELVRAAEDNENVACVGSAVFYAEERNRVWSMGGTVRPDYGFETEHLLMDRVWDGRGTETREVEYIPGCSLLVKATTLGEVGLFRDLFIYFEDVDWCIRSRQIGLRMLICTQSQVWHDWRRHRKEGTHWYIRYMTRNRILLCRIWGAQAMAWDSHLCEGRRWDYSQKLSIPRTFQRLAPPRMAVPRWYRGGPIFPFTCERQELSRKPNTTPLRPTLGFACLHTICHRDSASGRSAHRVIQLRWEKWPFFPLVFRDVLG